MSARIDFYSELQKRGRKRLKDILPLEIPLSLYVEPSNHCNFRCKFCARNFYDFKDYAGPFQHMNFDLFKKLNNELTLWGMLKVLKFYYLGEPMLNPAFISMLKLSLDSKIAERIEITTNGSILDEDNSRELISIINKYDTPVYMRFSIYSVIQERHSFITRSNVLVGNIRENITRLYEYRNLCGSTNPFIYVKMIDTFTEENALFFKTYKDISDEVVIEEPMNWSSYQDRDLLSGIYSIEQLSQIKVRRVRKACPYPFYTLAINSDGDVVVCCVDWSRHTKVGNIQEQTLKEIWQGEALKRLQMLHLDGKRYLNKACKNCLALNCCPELDDIDNIEFDK